MASWAGVGAGWLVVALPAAALALAACRPSFEPPEQPTAWTEEGSHRWRPLFVPASGGPGFTPVPPSWSGVSFANALHPESMFENQLRTNGSGVAAGDVDGDGRTDLYFARLDGPNVLYRNLGDWRFQDVTDEAGLAAADRFSTGVALVDVDGDQDLDLFLTSLGGPKELFLNDGGGRFRPSGEQDFVSGSGAMTAAFDDVDADGDLDLYVANYKPASVMDLYSPAERTFPKTVVREGEEFVIAQAFRQHYELAWEGGQPQRIEIGEGDEFYLNEGAGRFVASGFEAGRFLDSEGRTIREAPRDWGLAARFGDLDGDGDADLYVCNDLLSPDHVWMNQGDGSFREIASEAIRSTSASTMAVDFSDIDRDGDLDIFTADMLSRSSRLLQTQVPVVRMRRTLPGEVGGTQQIPHNALLVNRGDGTYAQVARVAGVHASEWSWSSIFVDVDLDGWEDLLIPNGHIRDMMDADALERVRSGLVADWRRNLLFFAPLPLRNVAFRNLGDLGFEETGAAWNFGPEPDISHGAALADLDGDGDLDVAVNRLDTPALLLRNDATARRISVRLAGAPPNTRGIGATIRVRGGPSGEQVKEIAAGGGYLSSSEPIAAFAAGEADSLQVIVEWRSGLRTVVWSRPDRLLEIREPQESGGAGGGEPREAPGAEETSEDAALHFRRVEGFGPLHDEPPFDDFARQPLLPLRLGRFGPGLAWHDLDADGDPDLVIGSGGGSPPTVYRNDGARFSRVLLRMRVPPLDQTAILVRPDGAGGATLWLGISSYEAPDASAAATVPGVLRVDLPAGTLGSEQAATEVSGAIGGERWATGSLAAADVDGDGWLDLFVAGRVVPGEYPRPGRSRLFFGRPDGGFREAPFTLPTDGFGPVAAASFSDLDGDGAPDLVLAHDWGPVRVLWNRGGRLAESSPPTLPPLRGRWNGLATGDLNEDGRPDLIATSWGRNTEYRVSTDDPLRLYAGDFDRNGSLDLLEAQRDPRIGGWAPLIGFDRFRRALRGMDLPVATYSAYADAALRELLGRALADAEVYEVVNLDHTAFLSGESGYEARPLPPVAQWAPAFGAAVADLDGDGHEDVVLAQNFFATDPDSPRYDAGRGLWLRGDGSGELEPVPGRESGIALYGDQRAAALADFDLDGRVDLAISQNGAETRLFRNERARPGLRVVLTGAAGNPDAIGASLQIVYADGLGPVREVKAGDGHWSFHDPTAVLGLRGAPVALRIRWPGGAVEQVPLDAGSLEVIARAPATGTQNTENLSPLR